MGRQGLWGLPPGGASFTSWQPKTHFDRLSPGQGIKLKGLSDKELIMKAIEYAEHGLPHQVCRCIDVDDPAGPGPGEVMVSIEASAINPADLLVIEGRYPGPE